MKQNTSTPMQPDQTPFLSSKTVTTSAIMIIVCGIILLLIYAKTLLMPLVAAAYAAMLLVPAVNKLEAFNIPRVLAISMLLIVSTFVFIAVGWFFGMQLSSFAEDLSGIEPQFRVFVQDMSDFLAENFGLHDIFSFKAINDKLFAFLKDNASNISSAAFSTIGSLGLLVLIPVYFFMFLLYRDHITAFAIKLFENHPKNKVIEIVTDLRSVIQKYISGVLQVIAILAVFNVIALSLLGIRHALFFGIFAAFMNVVPYIGPLIGSIFPIIFALLTKDSLFYPLGVFISFVVIQSIEGNYLTPKIVGSNVNINPIISLLALLIGSLIWGVVGMILFIPLAAILKKLLELSPATAVYGYLMGEEVKTTQKPRQNNKITRFFSKTPF